MNQKEIKIIISKVENIDNVYFDCFDTLIRRKYSIKYCFYKLADMLILEYKFPYDHKELVNSLYNIFSRCDVDFSKLVEDIYLHYDRFISDPFERFLENFKTTFVFAELDNIELDDNVKYLLELLKDKNLYLLSDYYLGKEIIIQYFVQLLGYNPFFDIIISCDYQASKEDGFLYQKITEPQKAIMIGDNYHNDVVNAHKAGLQAIQIDSYENFEKYYNFDNKYYVKEQKELFKLRDKSKKTYVSNFAYSLFAFCKKLYAELNINDVVYFLSRDGYFMKICFDTFLSYSNKKNIKTKYLETSRLALLLPSLNKDEFTPEILRRKIQKRTQWKISSGIDLLTVLGYSSEEIERLHLSSIQNNNYFESEEFMKLFDRKDFIESLNFHKEDARERFNTLVSESGKRLITVDLGWQGTSQNDMRKVLSEDKELIGYYLGTSYCIGETRHSKRQGILFDYANVSEEILYHFYDIEGLLKSDKGQLISYSMNGDKYLYDNGVKVYNMYSKKCQEIALDMFRKMCEINCCTPISVSSLQSVMNKIIEKKSVVSIAWGHFFYTLQNSNNEKIKPGIRDYLLAIKYKIKLRHPYLHKLLKDLKHEYIVHNR